MKKPAHNQDAPAERLSGSVERVTFHSEESGFCVLRAKVRGQHDLVTVIGSAASVTPGEYIEAIGNSLRSDRTCCEASIRIHWTGSKNHSSSAGVRP